MHVVNNVGHVFCEEEQFSLPLFVKMCRYQRLINVKFSPSSGNVYVPECHANLNQVNGIEGEGDMTRTGKAGERRNRSLGGFMTVRSKPDY